MTLRFQDPLVDDARLAREAIGNVDAFAELYRRHVERVYRYHLAHTGNVKDAEDLASQTFIAALEGIHTFRGSGSFAAWIMGIAAHKRARFYRASYHEIPLEEIPQRSNLSLLTDRVVSQSMQTDQILRALRHISRDRREALILCFFSELSPAEAGRVLRKSEAAVRMLISRGIHDLRTRTSLTLEMDYE